MKKIICSTIAAFCITMGTSNIAMADQVLAKYNGGEVKESDLDNVIKLMTNGARSFKDFPKELQVNAVRGYISQQIIIQEAKAANFQDNPELKKELEVLEKGLIQKYYLKEQIKDKVSDDKVKELYDNQVQAVKDQEEVKVRHILVKEEKEIRAIAKELDKKGKNFEEVAKKHSIDSSSKANGGELGYIHLGQTTKEFEKVVFETKPGQMSAPFKTDFGWHILKVEDRRKVKLPPFEDQKQMIKNQLQDQAMQQFMDELLKKSNVEILIEEKK